LPANKYRKLLVDKVNENLKPVEISADFLL
jgi:hypothetical protein